MFVLGRRLRYVAAGLFAAAAISASLLVLPQLLDHEPAGPIAEASPSPRPSPALRTPPARTPVPSPSPSPSPSLPPSPSATPVPPLLAERVTVLLLGTDSSPARAAAGDRPRTDAILLVSIDPSHRRAAMISLPRDTVDIPLADGEVWRSKVNAIYAQRGGAGVVSAIESLLAVDIDRYAAIDMVDFSRLIDALGGITVQVPVPLSDPTVRLWIGDGSQHLDGTRALGYVRHRRQGGDYERAARQQEALTGTLSRVASGEADVDLPQVAAGLGSLDTDFTAAELPVLVELMKLSRDAEIERLVLKPPEFATFEGIAGARGWVMVPAVEAMRSAVDELIGD